MFNFDMFRQQPQRPSNSKFGQMTPTNLEGAEWGYNPKPQMPQMPQMQQSPQMPQTSGIFNMWQQWLQQRGMR